MFKKIKIGPGVIVAAAFIGPGTITACSFAGANYGYTLLWALAFSVFATIILQEMSARLGIVTQKGLGEIIRQQFKNPAVKTISIILVLSAIFVGNSAYEAGNISGAGLGLESLFGSLVIQFENFSINFWGIAIGSVAFLLLTTNSYKLIEKALISLVIIMSIVFISTAIIAKPSFSEILKGTLIPSFPKGSLLSIIGLIGTTVVPYNLFLHASTVKEKWKSPEQLKDAKKDTIISMILGGLISMAIVIAASVAFYGTNAVLNNVTDLAIQLKPLLGNAAELFLGVGLFAAGVSSAITAPLAAAYATAGILGWDNSLQNKKFKAVWMFILGIGTLFYSIGFKPISIILFAQVANGILLPVIAGYLLWIMNKKTVLGNYKNSISQNIIGGVIVLITIVLGTRSILKVIGIL